MYELTTIILFNTFLKLKYSFTTQESGASDQAMQLCEPNINIGPYQPSRQLDQVSVAECSSSGRSQSFRCWLDVQTSE